jgi:hypothetical protein
VTRDGLQQAVRLGFDVDPPEFPEQGGVGRLLQRIFEQCRERGRGRLLIGGEEPLGQGASVTGLTTIYGELQQSPGRLPMEGVYHRTEFPRFERLPG